jgi:MoxR-like ATPase
MNEFPESDPQPEEPTPGLEAEEAVEEPSGESEASPELLAAREQVAALEGQIRRAVVGQEEMVRQVLAALLAGGHVLLEGVPGVGKTLLALALARAFGGSFSRVQFTPDLMPADVTGHSIYRPETGEFQVRKGPIFAHLLLADEINRAPAKTQAALLEAMQEQQVTIEGESFPLPRPFLTLATQNPLEHEGTYPLPEAQLDRFLMKVVIDYPGEEDERAIVRRITAAACGVSTRVVRSMISFSSLRCGGSTFSFSMNRSSWASGRG